MHYSILYDDNEYPIPITNFKNSKARVKCINAKN